MTEYKNYKICQYCVKPIHWSGVLTHKRWGRGYLKQGKYYHWGCFNKYQDASELRRK